MSKQTAPFMIPPRPLHRVTQKQREANELMTKAQIHDLASLFLRYHFGGERDLAKWSEIAVDGIKFSTPVTPFRSFNPCLVRKGLLHMTSLTQLLEDSSSWTILFQVRA